MCWVYSLSVAAAVVFFLYVIITDELSDGPGGW